MEMNGIAHFQLTVADYDAALAFYKPLLEFLEMKTLFDIDNFYYAVGSRTGIAISKSTTAKPGTRFDQQAIGLHHLCFRARSRDDIDTLYAFVVELGAKIIHAPQEDNWAPGYYSVLFEDPDGIRIEANFVPGKGHLD